MLCCSAVQLAGSNSGTQLISVRSAVGVLREKASSYSVYR